ncbi:MAG: GNAT family N-acetyltransferase [Hydrogenophaga sp.]|uniref:GNAT family N-acetyltransferase n=1 Tax=Hydrogenophaga sp. TaxID=1904254 RepID=UPI0016A6844E|nr:GNAT family N-acetyltransferase [Hydrogenophaga sp.]NIM41669.1 GNAT family N-acetyltransferase [Hydrogenophaga sp.]NIN26974.1 GNAT family N-acetyltransferase [Hydrogenophaga sp.]NIN31675.1 GNAT family N-acetyltransferase [Hydrogenophaga sp.]NIN55919.1 GNAT family N-acetyltransferase [Hydrogenophaga sp.]NIO52046.1 GNAT family N-acetyltransferase [Hydrogenophaga sp.]
MSAMNIRRDDLRGPEVRALLEEHLAHMRAISPPDSVHALDLDRLRHPAIAFWTVWDGAELLGCGALKRLGEHDGEIKSMRTATRHQRRGVARAMLEHILTYARNDGVQRLWLETGSTAHFVAARTLYAAFGFVPCGPFADYREDPHSAFMRLDL